MAMQGVERPACKMGLAQIFGLQIDGQAASASQDDLDAGEQLARAEGLGQIVVGAHLQPDDTIGLVAAGGEHQHRDVGFGAELATERQTVVARKHQIEHDQVDACGDEGALHGLAVAHRGDAQPVLLQIGAQQITDLAIVVNDQDVVRCVHAVIFSGLRRASSKTM